MTYIAVSGGIAEKTECYGKVMQDNDCFRCEIHGDIGGARNHGIRPIPAAKVAEVLNAADREINDVSRGKCLKKVGPDCSAYPGMIPCRRCTLTQALNNLRRTE